MKPDTTTMPNTYKPNKILKYFEYEHLPIDLQTVSKELCMLAIKMDKKLPQSAEKSSGLRKLLEAKDCFVRAKLDDMRLNRDI